MSDKDYYGDIDEMPLYNWRKCNEGKVHYTRKNLEKGTKKRDHEQWEKTYDSYLAEFGLGQDYARYYELKIELAVIQCEFVETDDRFLLNRIKQLEHEIKELLEREPGADTDTAIVHLSKWMGSLIDQKKVTVRMFYKMLNEQQKEAEALKKKMK